MSNFSPIKISICPKAKTPQAIKTAVFGWEEAVIDNFDELVYIAKTMPYSTSFFEKYENLKMEKKEDGKMGKESQRQKSNIVGVAPMVVFDIDSGLSIADTEKMLKAKNINYLIITTKSHGTEKAKGLDRFRLFIPLSWSKHQSFDRDGITLPQDKKAKEINIEELTPLQEAIATVLEIVEYVDRSPLVDLARKYVPSPENAKVFRNESGKNFEISEAGALAYKMFEAKREKIKERRKIAKELREKNVSYESMKDNSFSTFIDFGVLFSMDLAEVIYRYENEEEPSRFFTEGSYMYVKNDAHKYSIIFKSESGEYVFHDFKTGESGNIMTYMKEKFPYATSFKIALMLQKDFKNELGGTKIIKVNPAYYLEPLKEILKGKEITSIESANKTYIEKMELKSFKCDKNGNFTTTNSQGFQTIFKIDAEQMKEVSSLYRDILQKKTELSTQSVIIDENDEERVHLKM